MVEHGGLVIIWCRFANVWADWISHKMARALFQGEASPLRWMCNGGAWASRVQL